MTNKIYNGEVCVTNAGVLLLDRVQLPSQVTEQLNNFNMDRPTTRDDQRLADGQTIILYTTPTKTTYVVRAVA